MAEYEITAPDGRKFRVSGNGTREQALAQIQAQYQTKSRGFMGPVAPQKFMGPMPETGFKEAALGFADVGIAGARGTVHKLAGTAYGIAGGINPNDTYLGAQDRYRGAVERGETAIRSDRLRTPTGPVVADRMASVMGAPVVGGRVNPLPLLSRAGQWVGDAFGPEAKDATESAITLASLPLGRVTAGTPKPRATPEDVVARGTTGGNAGAAAAATNVQNATPGLRQAIVAAGRGGRSVDQQALQRHVEADSLPVPIRLTAGEATQNPSLISQERNIRGKYPDLANRMDETNKALGQNLNAIRDDVGQGVFSTNAVEHGDSIIAGYMARDAASTRAIDVLYHRLRQAAGGDIPVDARAVLNNASAQLHRKLLYDHAPPEIMRTLGRLAESNSMTFENFESMRTNLARVARSSADGNVKAAAAVIRDALESLPLRPGAEHLKDIADAARAAARRRFMELEADPAYEAAVNGTVPADKFVQRFVIGAPRDQLAVMAKAFENDPGVRQTISVSVLDHLRDAARLDPGYNGNFSSAGFSRALQALDPKANLIFDAKTAETLSNLRNVANYTTVQPRGSFVNNSNTFVAGLASNAGQVAEGVINYSTLGLGAPLGRMARRAIENSPERRMVRNSLQEGAGLRPTNALSRKTP